MGLLPLKHFLNSRISIGTQRLRSLCDYTPYVVTSLNEIMSWNKSKPGQKQGGKGQAFSEATSTEVMSSQNKALKLNLESVNHMAGSELKKRLQPLL